MSEQSSLKSVAYQVRYLTYELLFAPVLDVRNLEGLRMVAGLNPARNKTGQIAWSPLNVDATVFTPATLEGCAPAQPFGNHEGGFGEYKRNEAKRSTESLRLQGLTA